MAVYLIADIEITDPARYAEYVRVVPETVAKYGGRFLVRGGEIEKLEGTWTPRRIVVLQFDSIDRAREWWTSEDYRGPKALRRSASVANMILVQGV